MTYPATMIREGTSRTAPSAAAMRSAWPDTIITAEGMRHALASVPARAELVMLAWEEDGEIVVATAGRAWWQAEPHHGTCRWSPSTRAGGAEGIGLAPLAEAADAHLTSIDATTTRAGSVTSREPARAATRLGFRELAASASFLPSIRGTVVPGFLVLDDVRIVPFADLDDPRALYELDVDVSNDIPNEEFDGICSRSGVDEFWRSPLPDQDASLVAFVGEPLAAPTMIRIDAPSGRPRTTSRA